LKSEHLEDLLRYRIGQAHETLREAEILLAESAHRTTPVLSIKVRLCSQRNG